MRGERDEPRRPRQGPARRRRDVRRGRAPLRPHEHAAPARAGPALARGRPCAALDLRPGQKVLDVAAGTAVSTVALARAGAWCVATDFSLGMLRAGAGPRRPEGRRRRLAPAVRRRHVRRGDDLVRPAQRRRPGRRAGRVRPGHPARRPAAGLRVRHADLAPFRAATTTRTCKHVLPTIARPVSSQPRGLPLPAESIQAWPDQAALRRGSAAAGWTDVAWRNLTFGVVALHHAVRAA